MLHVHINNNTKEAKKLLHSSSGVVVATPYRLECFSLFVSDDLYHICLLQLPFYNFGCFAFYGYQVLDISLPVHRSL